MSRALKSRGLVIFKEFGSLRGARNKEANRWASLYSHFAASGITAWLETVAPHLDRAALVRITRETNASLWRGRHDASRYATPVFHDPEGPTETDPGEMWCESIDRQTKGEYESYGSGQALSPGNKVVVAIDRHVYQGFVGTVLRARADNKYLVEFYTEIERVSGYFGADELIALKTYVRSPHEKIPHSYRVG